MRHEADIRTTPDTRRLIEFRLLLFALLIVATGMCLNFFGKMSSVPPLTTGSIDINTADGPAFTQALGIDLSDADSVVTYRAHLSGGHFVSTFGLRRFLTKEGIDANIQQQNLYVRTIGEISAGYWSALIGLIVLSFLVHGIFRRFAPAADPFLLPTIIILIGFGLMAAFSVHDPYRDTFAFNSQAFGVIFFGFPALLVPLSQPFKRLPLHRYTYAYAIFAFVLLAALMVLGRGPAATHIELFGFEPIEFIKVLLIFFIASYLADRRFSQRDRVSRRKYLPSMRDTLPLIAIYLFALTLFGAVKDLGPAVLLFGSFVAMLYLVTGNVLYPVIGLVLLLAAGYVGDKIGIGFFATRVEMWLHPWDNSNRLGGQLAQGLWGVATGGIFGSGLGLGGAAFVPRSGSDMVFTTIGEETGLSGALCVLFLYTLLVFRGFKIARNAIDDFDRLLASGLTILIGLQALVITGGTIGVMPLTGITLPFVAYGTSSLVANFLSVGLLLQISAKSVAAGIQPEPPAAFIHCSSRLTMALTVGLLLLIGGRLAWLQGLDDDPVATHGLLIPDADGVVRDHKNPRLIAYAEGIVRGRILDRNGTVLAANAEPGAGTNFLTGGVPRLYPLGPVGADVVYAVEQPRSDTDPLGADTILRGYRTLDDLLPLYRRKDLPFAPHPVGSDVELTLDIDLQRAAQIALEQSATTYGDGRGAAVALDCKTGALLAAATVPTFDPNSLTPDSWSALHTTENEAQPLLNRAFAGGYPPGSVFKLVTATAAYQENKQDLIFQCNHTLPEIRWEFDGREYVRRHITDDEEFIPHGQTDMAKALRVSCNVYFAQLGAAIGAAPLEHTIHQYGLRLCPPTDLLGRDLPDCAYGQGTIVVTPYQMARVAQTVGNGGVLEPQQFFVGRRTTASATRLLDSSDADQLGQMLAGVVTDGTAAGVFPDMSVAGKTGSAQLEFGKPHSWFVGFAPVDNPSVAFACIIEHGGHGRTAAAPVCRAIVQNILK